MPRMRPVTMSTVPDGYFDMFPEPTEDERAKGNICGRCHACLDTTEDVFDRVHRPMVLCPGCGNKRCPQASDCTLPCTDSNEPGQHGSVYGTPIPRPGSAE